MTDKMRWRYGDTNPVAAKVGDETVIEIGDLLWMTDQHHTAKPVSMIEEYAMSQQEFAEQFLGVAMQRSRSGDTAPIRVATTGVFEFDCPPGEFNLGDYITVRYEDGYRNQEVCGAIIDLDAFARVARHTTAPDSTVLVDIVSTVMRGGIVSR